MTRAREAHGSQGLRGTVLSWVNVLSAGAAHRGQDQRAAPAGAHAPLPIVLIRTDGEGTQVRPAGDRGGNQEGEKRQPHGSGGTLCLLLRTCPVLCLQDSVSCLVPAGLGARASSCGLHGCIYISVRTEDTGAWVLATGLLAELHS